MRRVSDPAATPAWRSRGSVAVTETEVLQALRRFRVSLLTHQRAELVDAGCSGGSADGRDGDEPLCHQSTGACRLGRAWRASHRDHRVFTVADPPERPYASENSHVDGTTSPSGMVLAMGAQSRRFTSLASGSGKGTAVVVCAVMLLAGCGGSGGSASDASTPVVRGDVAATSSLAVSGTPATAAVGATIALSTAGGTGTEAVSYATSGTGCKVTDSSLTATAAGTCAVTATKGTQTGTATFTFAIPLTLPSDTAVSAPGTPPVPTVVAGTDKVTVTVAPGTSGGAPTSYTVTAYRAGTFAAGTCTVTGASGFCDVTALTGGITYTVKATATNAAGTSGASGASSPVTVSTRAFTVSGTPATAAVGTPIALSSVSWGSGTVTYSTTSTGCKVTDTFLTATVAGTCVVTATQVPVAGEVSRTTYESLETYAQTGTASFIFTAAAAATLTVSNTTMTGTVGTPITLTTAGGSGTGQVTFASSSGCTITGALLTTSTAGTCTVTATQGTRTSAAVAFTFAVAGSPAVTAVSAPGVPATPTVVAGDGKVTVTVAAGTSGGTPASFLVTASPWVSGKVKTCTVRGASGSCTVTGLSNDTTYTFTATATNTSGTSAASSPATRLAPPGRPSIPGTIGSNRVSVMAGSSGGDPTSFLVTLFDISGATVFATCTVTLLSGARFGSCLLESYLGRLRVGKAGKPIQYAVTAKARNSAGTSVSSPGVTLGLEYLE